MPIPQKIQGALLISSEREGNRGGRCQVDDRTKLLQNLASNGAIVAVPAAVPDKIPKPPSARAQVSVWERP